MYVVQENVLSHATCSVVENMCMQRKDLVNFGFLEACWIDSRASDARHNHPLLSSLSMEDDAKTNGVANIKYMCGMRLT